MRVLLVDDEKEFVATLAERLSYRGIEADFALGGDDALRMVGGVNYDLAVLDMKMPGISGLQLKKRLAEICPTLKFIFLTGHGSEEDYRAGSRESVYYLVKPISIDTLVGKMHEAIQKEGTTHG
ncbi:MAG: response regulator [Desulfopila sp.]|jgi:DNA-binding response OmpR family regulator|nr:response regulator [Desulfopila sp.]